MTTEGDDQGYVPIREITDWRIGGQADRPYDNPDQAAADILSLLGVQAPVSQESPKQDVQPLDNADTQTEAYDTASAKPKRLSWFRRSK